MLGGAWSRNGQYCRHFLSGANTIQESKLFDIANSLADVMICVPSLNQDTGFRVGPRDLIHSLSALLGSFRGGNPAITGILQDKLETLGLTITSPQRLVDLSPEDERDEWSDNAPRPIAWSHAGIYSSTTAPPDLLPSPIQFL